MPGTITTDLADVNLAEATTNWLPLGTFAAAMAANDDPKIQGNYCFDSRVSANSGWYLTPNVSYDLTDGRHVFMWQRNDAVAASDTIANGGQGVSISSDATPTLTGTTPNNGPTNSKTWFLNGSDGDVLGGWTCYVVDPTGTPTLLLGSPTISAILRIGIRAKVVGTISNKSKNIMIDAVRVGTGLTVKDGTEGAPATFADVLTTAMSNTNAWGVLTRVGGTYYLSGKHRFGATDQSAVTFFKDTDKIVVWRDYPVASTFYEFALNGHASYGTTVQCGSYSSGLVSSGCAIKGAGSAVWSVTVNANAALKLYGSVLSQLRRMTLGATSEMRGCSVSDFGDIEAGGATIDGNTFQGIRTAAPISATCAVSVTTSSALTNNTFVDCAPAVKWNTNVDPNGKLNGTAFISGGTGHGIEFGTNTPGDPTEISLTDVTFSGYGATGTSDAAIYNNSGKHLIVNILGTGNEPTYCDGGGASTTVVVGQRTLQLTGLVSGSDIVILDAGTIVERVNVNENSGTTYDYVYGYVEDDYIDVGVFKHGYVPFYVRTYHLLNASGSLPIAQAADRNYNDPA